MQTEKQQSPKQWVQADFVQACILLIESYIMKPLHGEDPSFLYITQLTLVPFDMLIVIWV